MKRPDVMAVMIVLGVVAVAVIGLVADSFSTSNLAGQAMYVKGYTAAVQEVKTDYKIERPIPSIVARSALTESQSGCDCSDDDDLQVITVTEKTISPITVCSENDGVLAGTSSTRHNHPGVQETLTIKQGSTVLQEVRDGCRGDELIQYECDADNPEIPRELSPQLCDLECRDGRCATDTKPAGTCQEIDQGVRGFVGRSGGRTTGYLMNVCLNRKVLREAYCGGSPISPFTRERYTVCDGECRSGTMVVDGTSMLYGRCV